MQKDHRAVLNAAGAFLGRPDLVWQDDKERINASADRIRKLPFQDILINNPVAIMLRRTLIPQRLRDNIRQSRQMRERPTLTAADRAMLERRFARDYLKLKSILPGYADLDLSYPFLPS